MKIVCNGESLDIREGISVEEYIRELGLNPDTVVVECNGNILLRENYKSEILQDGTVLEIIRFVGGG